MAEAKSMVTSRATPPEDLEEKPPHVDAAARHDRLEGPVELVLGKY